MHKQAHNKTPEQMIDAVFALDLDAIKFKLMDAKEGHGWSREEADRHELEYRRFLALIAKYPEEAITPNSDVDKFWHGHILDTMKYAEDCAHVFGYFLHHFPYFGMRDDEDAANLAEAAARTRRLYEQEFGKTSDAAQSYCARVTSEEGSYCARVASQGASYCARVAAPVEASYCARVATPVEASYCARVAAPVEDATYCARVATGYYESAQPAYYAKIVGKGRPGLGSDRAS
ncbi:glycine-rich domain-containing protein [Herbaspirillum sp. GCM10030257]|uniref:glycine-rich domain-containing protein n=1 Tax=Herbaspirillum sp. GCM10030257 TaxID=3273393 RepID=UPI00362095E9